MAVKISYNALDKILSYTPTQVGMSWNFMDLDTRLDVLYELNDFLKEYRVITRIKRSELEGIVADVIEKVMDEKDSEDERLYAVREFYNNFYGD